MEIAYAGLNTATQSVPTHVNVPRSELLGDSTLKWYKTIAGTPAVGLKSKAIFLFWLERFNFLSSNGHVNLLSGIWQQILL